MSSVDPTFRPTSAAATFDTSTSGRARRSRTKRPSGPLDQAGRALVEAHRRGAEPSVTLEPVDLGRTNLAPSSEDDAAASDASISGWRRHAVRGVDQGIRLVDLLGQPWEHRNPVRRAAAIAPAPTPVPIPRITASTREAAGPTAELPAAR